MEKPNTIKSIQLNSRFADDPSNLSNPTWTISPNITGIESFKIKNMIIPISSYNIDDNNKYIKMYQNVSGTTTTNLITMTSQNYNSSNIASSLQTFLNSQGSLYMSVNFSTSANKLMFGSSTGSFYFMDTGNGKDCYENLGISVGNSAVSTYTAGNCIDLSGVKVINLESNSLDGIDISGYNRRIIGSIPIEESVNTIASYQDDSTDYIDTNIFDISQITISIKDEKYRDLVQRSHWSLTLNLIVD